MQHDDWLIVVTENKIDAMNLKNRISGFINQQFKPKLDDEKTVITTVVINKRIGFLGYEIIAWSKNQEKIQPFKTTNKQNNYPKTTTSRQINIIACKKTLRNNPINKGYLDQVTNQGKSTGTGMMLNLSAYEITSKYDYVAMIKYPVYTILFMC